jgi:hypothetical protein
MFPSGLLSAHVLQFRAVNVETFTVFLGNRNRLRDRGELAPRKANGKRRYAQQWPRQEWPASAARLAAMSSAALGDEGPPEGQIGSPQRKLPLPIPRSLKRTSGGSGAFLRYPLHLAAVVLEALGILEGILD